MSSRSEDFEGASDDQVVLTGEQRRWVQENGAPHVTHVEIKETGHMVPVEGLEGWSRAISSWLGLVES